MLLAQMMSSPTLEPGDFSWKFVEETLLGRLANRNGRVDRCFGHDDRSFAGPEKRCKNPTIFYHWIDLRENLQETHGFLPSNMTGFPVKIFPSSNSMI